MPSRAAERLLERMRASKADWGAHDLHTLYVGYGFDCDEGGKHRLYIHPVYSELRATVGRHSPLAKGYVSDAVKLIDELSHRQAEEPRP